MQTDNMSLGTRLNHQIADVHAPNSLSLARIHVHEMKGSKRHVSPHERRDLPRAQHRARLVNARPAPAPSPEAPQAPGAAAPKAAGKRPAASGAPRNVRPGGPVRTETGVWGFRVPGFQGSSPEVSVERASIW